MNEEGEEESTRELVPVKQLSKAGAYIGPNYLLQGQIFYQIRDTTD